MKSVLHKDINYLIKQYRNKTVMLAGEQVIRAYAEEHLQTRVLILQNVAKYFGMKTFSEKTDTAVCFVGQDAVRYKMAVDKKSLHQVKNFRVSVVEFAVKTK